MSVKSKILPVLALTATLGISACIAHVREPYGYYGGGYRSGYYGHSHVYTGYPRTRTVYRRGHDYDDRRYRDDRRRGDRDHDDDRDWRWHR